jgi:hygromycin-B 4-O-kinase
VDDEAALAFLRMRFGPKVGVTAMRPGEWSSPYAVAADGGEFVARFSAFPDAFEKDVQVARHASAALPIPPIVEWGPFDGAFYAIAPRMPGEHIDEIDAARLLRVLPSVFAALDAIRRIDVSDASGFGGWRADGSTEHRTWRGFLLGVATDKAPQGGLSAREQIGHSAAALDAFDEGYARMRELVDHCPDDRHLIHDDLMNRNVLVDGDRVSAVLDWGSSMYGDFLYDLAKLVFYGPWQPEWRHVDFAVEALGHYAAIGLAVPNFSERLECYCLRIGLADMAYSAFRGRERELMWKADRVKKIVRP